MAVRRSALLIGLLRGKAPSDAMESSLIIDKTINYVQQAFQNAEVDTIGGIRTGCI